MTFCKEMIRILIIHAILLISTAVAFFTLGAIDKNRFEKASLTHHPELLFSHARNIVRDGGSIVWESLIYSAHEGRTMRVWTEDGEDKIGDGFQGIWWTWKYHNLGWIWLIIGGSLVGSLTSYLRTKKAEQGRAHQLATRPVSNFSDDSNP